MDLSNSMVWILSESMDLPDIFRSMEYTIIMENQNPIYRVYKKERNPRFEYKFKRTKT